MGRVQRDCERTGWEPPIVWKPQFTTLLLMDSVYESSLWLLWIKLLSSTKVNLCYWNILFFCESPISFLFGLGLVSAHFQLIKLSFLSIFRNFLFSWISVLHHINVLQILCGYMWLALSPFEFVINAVNKLRLKKAHIYKRGLTWWFSGKESACQCRRHGFDPSVGKISWRRKW